MVCGAEKDHVFLHDPHICSVLPLLDLQAFRIFKLYNISWSSFNIGLLFMHKEFSFQRKMICIRFSHINFFTGHIL